MIDTYWAATDDHDELTRVLESHIQSFGSGTSNTNRMIMTWQRNFYAYYSGIIESDNFETALNFGGEQGELVKMQVPQAKSLINQLVSIVSKNRLSYQCIAVNNDSSTIGNTKIGNALVDQLIIDENLDIKGSIVAESAAVLGTSALKTCWRTDKGVPYTAGENGEAVFTGKVAFETVLCTDIICDVTKQMPEDLDWVIIRTKKNKWDLVRQHPELKDAILDLRTTKHITDTILPNGEAFEDQVIVWEFYHKPTPALPMGRMTFFSDKDTVYHDGVNLYECIPLDFVRPQPILGAIWGFPIFSDLLPMQELLDASFSAIATNQTAFAAQSILVPRGADIKPTDIKGRSFIYYTPQNATGGGKPEPLQLTATPPEVFNFINLLLSNMQQISNISGALRGSPPPGATSGKSIATLIANALEFIESFTKAYNLAIEGALSKAILFTSKFATVPQLVTMVGKNNQAILRPFVGADLKSIMKVKVRPQSAMMMTQAGRQTVADALMPTGLIKSPQKYLDVINGAPVEDLYETENSENELVAWENDQLLDGVVPEVDITNDHGSHMRQHLAIKNKAIMTRDKKVMDAVTEHILLHINTMQQQPLSPDIYAALHQGQSQPMQAPQMPAPAEGSNLPASPATPEVTA